VRESETWYDEYNGCHFMSSNPCAWVSVFLRYSVRHLRYSVRYSVSTSSILCQQLSIYSRVRMPEAYRKVRFHTLKCHVKHAMESGFPSLII